MGWTFCHRPKGTTNLAFFRQEFGAGVLDVASPSPTVTYIAYQPIDSDDVVAIVCLTRWDRSDPDFNFGYKDMVETMGPAECGCPKRILDLLTPTDNQWANEWRDACRTNLGKRRRRPRLRVGMVLEWDPPLHFANGENIAQLEVMQVKPLKMKHPGDTGWSWYKIKRYHLDSATVVTAH